jgi:DNA-binding HxlR family transcriptional regulator
MNRSFDSTPSPTMESMPSEAMPTPTTALATALERVGDRWSFLLVEALLGGARRFNELHETLPGIAANILADRLRRLERDGVVLSTPYSRRPVRFEYALSADGRDLASALRLLADWGARRASSGPDPYEPLAHATCGTRLETRFYCPTCATAVRDAEAGQERIV